MDGTGKLIMREVIILKAWLWRMVLGVAITWCRWCRWWHTWADKLCGWLARKAAGEIGVEKLVDPNAEPVELQKEN